MRDENQLEKIIQRVHEWDNAVLIKTERISGLTNSNYKIEVDGERFVLRISGDNTERLGINRIAEAAALKRASEAGLAPELIAFLMPEGHVVTRWVSGKHWTAAEFRTPENVQLLTETVKQIHALAANKAEFSPFQRIRSFLEVAAEFNVEAPVDLSGFISAMDAVEKDQQQDRSDWRRFCHNDLVSVNYLYVDKDHQIKVLDWEFSGLGDIYYDLATIVYTHDSDGPISQLLEDQMLKCYFGQVRMFQRKRLAGMKLILMLFTGAWALAQHGMCEAGLIQRSKGFDYFEFGEYLFNHDLPELLKAYKSF